MPLSRVWYASDTHLVRVWYSSYTHKIRNRYASDTHLERVWYAYYTHQIHIRYASDTHLRTPEEMDEYDELSLEGLLPGFDISSITKMVTQAYFASVLSN